MIYGGEEVKHTLTLTYHFTYSFSESYDSSLGKRIGYDQHYGGTWWVRFSLVSAVDSFTNQHNPVTADMCLPFDSKKCAITSTTQHMSWSGISGSSVSGNSKEINITFGEDNRASNVTAASYNAFLNIPQNIELVHAQGASYGTISCGSSGTIILVIDYYIKNPQFSYDGESVFTLGFPTTSAGNRDNSTRNILAKFKQPTVVPGTRSQPDAQLTYRLCEKNIATNITSEVWSVLDSEIELNPQSNLYEVSNPALTYRVTRDYILKTEFGEGSYDQIIESFTTPGPEIVKPPEIEMRYIGEDFELTSAQQVNHLISAVHGDSITLWWNNPIIYYAHGLRLNFQILISRNSIPQNITDDNILDIVPGNTSGRDYRTFPYSNGYVERIFRDGTYNTFFLYQIIDDDLGPYEELPIFEGTDVVPSNNNYKEAEDGMPYLYSYTISAEQFERYANNYDKVYFAIRPVIEEITDLNPDMWREGSELKETPRRDEWRPFIYIKDTNSYFCSDEYWNEETHKIELGPLEWRKCRIYYCPDGEKWKVVSAQYANNNGMWSFC